MAETLTKRSGKRIPASWICKQIDANQPFHVISGYRSGDTNAFLRAHSAGADLLESCAAVGSVFFALRKQMHGFLVSWKSFRYLAPSLNRARHGLEMVNNAADFRCCAPDSMALQLLPTR
jgi:hypothetical protein